MVVNDNNSTAKLALLFISAVLFSFLITSTVFVSGCVSDKQTCTADNLTNCTNTTGNAACYKGECTTSCTEGVHCATNYECITDFVVGGEITEENTNIDRGLCVLKQTEKKADTSPTKTTETPSSGAGENKKPDTSQPKTTETSTSQETYQCYNILFTRSVDLEKKETWRIGHGIVSFTDKSNSDSDFAGDGSETAYLVYKGKSVQKEFEMVSSPDGYTCSFSGSLKFSGLPVGEVKATSKDNARNLCSRITDKVSAKASCKKNDGGTYSNSQTSSSVSVVSENNLPASNGGLVTTTSGGSGTSSFINVFNSGIPVEILSSSLMKLIIIFLLLFAIVYTALETAKFPAATQGTNTDKKTRAIIAAAFGLMGAVGTLIYPGLFPIQILATKFVMLLVIIVVYFILSGLIFSGSTWLPNASLLTSFSRKFVAFVFFMTMFTMLFLDTPVNMSIENHPVCQITDWNAHICNDGYNAGCLAADYASGSIVCCEEAFSDSVGKMGKYNYCKTSVPSQKDYFLSAYTPGTPTPDDALCSFDLKYEMPKVGHNMCATLGEFFIGPGLYRDYKYIVLQFLWIIAGILCFVGFYNRFHDKKWFWWVVAWFVGIFILLILGLF